MRLSLLREWLKSFYSYFSKINKNICILHFLNFKYRVVIKKLNLQAFKICLSNQIRNSDYIFHRLVNFKSKFPWDFMLKYFSFIINLIKFSTNQIF